MKKLTLGNRNVQIVSVEGKDVLTKNYTITDKTLKIGSLDYSMETDELRNLSKTLIKEDKKKERYYTYGIINVTFKYKVPKEKHVYTGDASETIKTKDGKVSVPKFRINKGVKTDKYRYDRELKRKANTTDKTILELVRGENKYYKNLLWSVVTIDEVV